MKTIKKRSDKITRIASFYCMCNCKRLVLKEVSEDGYLMAVAVCYKCDMEIEHASDLSSLKRKLKLS